MFKRYKELLELPTQAKPTKISTASPLTILRLKNLVVPYLAWEFVNMGETFFPVETIVSDPSKLMQDNHTKELKLSSMVSCKLYNSMNIYTVFYVNSTKSIVGTSFSNMIVSCYEITSELFVNCKVRYINKQPALVALESYHGPDVLVSLQDIFAKYGKVDENIYNRRLAKALHIEVRDANHVTHNQ